VRVCACVRVCVCACVWEGERGAEELSYSDVLHTRRRTAVRSAATWPWHQYTLYHSFVEQGTSGAPRPGLSSSMSMSMSMRAQQLICMLEAYPDVC
jgi:hypothetical protein